MSLTSQGKEVAQKALTERREEAKTEKKIDNGSLPAGSPMYFSCLMCGLQNIVVSETYISKPSTCKDCSDLKNLGWDK